MRNMMKAPPRSPVLSLTVLDSKTLSEGIIRPDSRVLVVARSAEANRTHPHVVSVPTQRIPEAMSDAIVASAARVGTDPTSGVTYFRDSQADNSIHNDHHPLVSAVESLMSRKLGFADALERGVVRFRATLRAQVDGAALYDNLSDSDVYERVSMLNAIVELDEEAAVLPLKSTSYSVMAWTSIESFLEGVDRGDPTVIGPEFDPLTFCVHGVCLQAAQASLAHLIGHPLFDGDAPDLDPLYLIPAGPYLLPYTGPAAKPLP
jgi:hypothetical protein